MTGLPNLSRAEKCVRNPEALANWVYSGRMGNSRPGDGWAFRGRGIIMLTGWANYVTYGDMVGVDLIADPDLAADPATALKLALAFWARAGCNALCDVSNWRLARVAINGGTVGLDDVASIRATALSILS